MTKVFCPERRCGWRGLDRDVLTAPHPFDDDDTIHGCPRCHAVAGLTRACDATNCWTAATCGTPTPSGYRHTCSMHRPDVTP